MAVVFRYGDQPIDDETAKPIMGRPDHADHNFGVMRAKRHPPYVFSIRGASCLVHKVAYVDLHWWRVSNGGHSLVKLKRPVLIAHTTCSMVFRLEGRTARTCLVPAPESLLCGRCHGDLATFGKDGAATAAGLTRHVAHLKLGCAVPGY